MSDVTVRVSEWIPGPFEMPPGHTEFVVGDSHGHREQLAAVLKAGRDLAPDAALTLLGDLADRGPDSLGCLRLGIDAVLEYREERGGGTYLPGNHEQMLIATMAAPCSRLGRLLFHNGGQWVLALRDTSDLVGSLRDELGQRRYGVLTQNNLLFENGCTAVLHRRIGNTILVHAGIDPEAPDPEAWINSVPSLTIPWDEKTPLWIRDPFLDHKEAFPGNVVVVHGHTPEYRTVRGDTGDRAEPGEHRVDGHRLGLDGGSFGTGIVTAALLRDGAYRIITAYQPVH